MFFIIFLLCLLQAASAQTQTTDAILRAMNIELDKNCINSKIQNYENLVNEFKTCSDVQGELGPGRFNSKNDVSKFCQSSNPAIKCTDLILQKLDPCLSHAQKEILKYRSLWGISVADYLCKDNGKEITEVLKVDVSNCAQPNKAQRCSEIFRVLIRIKAEEFYSEFGCRSQFETVSCMADMYESCENKLPYNFIKKLGYVGYEVTPCKKYLSSSNIAQTQRTDAILRAMNIELDKNCINSKIQNYENLINEFKTCSDVQGELGPGRFNEKDDVSKFCQSSNPAIKCTDLILQKLDPCLSQAQKEILKYRSLWGITVADYLCKENGKEITEVLKVDVSNCDQANKAQRCSEIFRVLIGIKAEEFYSESGCRNQFETVSCLADMYESCENKLPYNFIKKLGYVGYEVTPCKKYLSSSNLQVDENSTGTRISKVHSYIALMVFLSIKMRNSYV